MRKGRGIIIWKERRNFYKALLSQGRNFFKDANKLNYALAIYMRMIILRMSLILRLVVRMFAFLLAWQTAVCNTMLVWPSPKVILPRLNIQNIWEVGWTGRFLCSGSSDSILEWLHLHYFSVSVTQKIDRHWRPLKFLKWSFKGISPIILLQTFLNIMTFLVWRARFFGDVFHIFLIYLINIWGVMGIGI